MKGMSSLDVDLIQHDNWECKAACYTEIQKLRGLEECTPQDHSKHYMETVKGKPSTFLLLYFPHLCSPPPNRNHSSNNMYKNNNHGPHILPKCSSRPDIQLLWSARRGTQRSGIHYKLSSHRQHRSSDARREQPGATRWKPLLKMCGGLTLFPSPRSRALRGSDKHTQDVRTTE